jgi:hypothetical protein
MFSYVFVINFPLLDFSVSLPSPSSFPDSAAALLHIFHHLLCFYCFISIVSRPPSLPLSIYTHVHIQLYFICTYRNIHTCNYFILKFSTQHILIPFFSVPTSSRYSLYQLNLMFSLSLKNKQPQTKTITKMCAHTTLFCGGQLLCLLEQLNVVDVPSVTALKKAHLPSPSRDHL